MGVGFNASQANLRNYTKKDMNSILVTFIRKHIQSLKIIIKIYNILYYTIVYKLMWC